MPEKPACSDKIPSSALPTTEQGAIAWLRLFRSSRVGPTTFIRLLRENGSAEAALAALPEVASAAGVRNYVPCSRAIAEEEWAAALAVAARPLLLGAPDYPPLLATIADAPPLLWAIGDPALGFRASVALVGARNASAIGTRMSAQLARDLGALGYVIVSGLARGIDTAAHSAAIEHGTIAVQAGGIDTIYPAANTALAAEIADRGLRLSEMPVGHEPRPQDFPRRNRIISGLAQGVIVVEGALRSGSLITARNALDQGREVMAVPGSPLDPRAGGCNQLIRDGAALVRTAEDVVEALASQKMSPIQKDRTPRNGARPIERPQSSETVATPPPRSDEPLLTLLGPVPVPEDVLIRETGRPAAQIAAELTDLELSGQIRRHPGGLVSLA